MSDPPASKPPIVPDLDLAPSSARVPKVSAPPPSSRMPAATNPPPVRSAAPPRSSDPNIGAGKSITFDAGDDDDFDMEIERNVATTSLANATSSRAPGAHTSGRPSSGGLRPGLELAAPSRMARAAAAERSHYADEPGAAMKLAGLAVSAVIAGGTAFSLWKYVYHARGIDVTSALPHAFDGTSAPESGAVSLVALVLAIAIGFMGLKLKPHAWTIVGAGGLMLLLALAMVTVTLGSTGENSVPPDGVLLVPYLVPSIVLLIALGIVGRAGRRFAFGYGARRAIVLPFAAVAGVVGLLAFQLSRFAR
jgi:hypothetical protein